ncbi:MAG: LLM class flavin-dependent oxidoreductase [Chloroflexi bacterium]|nr:LLM class flavin-dependent oxidoreductase [Chloroflexota bacterium]
MTTLEFGAWAALRPVIIEERHGGVAAEAYDADIREARLLDELGYQYYWIIEHQASYVGAITTPSVFLAAVARETERIRIGAMIWVLPFHNPVQLAEEVAMLDHLSHGRVEFGTGIGMAEHEFIRMGLDFYQRREMGEEALEIIERAWTLPEVTYDGRFWKFNEMLPRPLPYQKPHPPIWIAAHSLRAFEWAAEQNYDVASNVSTDDEMVEKFTHYRKVWAECEYPGPMPRQMLVRPVHIAETDAKAREEAERYLMESMRLGREMVVDTRVGVGTHPRGKGKENNRYSRANARIFAQSRNSYDFWIDEGLALIGSPETVARQIAEKQARIGFTVFVANHRIGMMPADLVERSIRLFAEEVFPAFERPTEPVVPQSLAAERLERIAEIKPVP